MEVERVRQGLTTAGAPVLPSSRNRKQSKAVRRPQGTHQSSGTGTGRRHHVCVGRGGGVRKGKGVPWRTAARPLQRW